MHILHVTVCYLSISLCMCVQYNVYILCIISFVCRKNRPQQLACTNLNLNMSSNFWRRFQIMQKLLWFSWVRIHSFILSTLLKIYWLCKYIYIFARCASHNVNGQVIMWLYCVFIYILIIIWIIYLGQRSFCSCLQSVRINHLETATHGMRELKLRSRKLKNDVVKLLRNYGSTEHWINILEVEQHCNQEPDWRKRKKKSKKLE